MTTIGMDHQQSSERSSGKRDLWPMAGFQKSKGERCDSRFGVLDNMLDLNLHLFELELLDDQRDRLIDPQNGTIPLTFAINLPRTFSKPASR
ncbi:hypothetical protein D6C98_04750 [Aureobasidium pullulans]|nr:hypothetical protein D6C98_04750 [Aureobasidium pullulans]